MNKQYSPTEFPSAHCTLRKKDTLKDCCQVLTAGFILTLSSWASGQAAPVNPTTGIAPNNPFLADSPWPVAHGNPYAQDMSLHPGPIPGESVELTFVDLSGYPAALPILLYSGRYEDGSRVVWGGNLDGSIVKMRVAANGEIDENAIFTYETGGGIITQSTYGAVDHQNRCILPFDDEILILEDGGDSTADISKKSFEVKELGIIDSILAVGITYDGWIAFASNSGIVGVVDLGLTKSHVIDLGTRLGDNLRNGLAIDEEGGIYLNTVSSVFRVQWDGASESLDVAWRVELDLGPDGSGTTSTLMGTGEDEDQLILVIDSNGPANNLVALWRDEIPQEWNGLPNEDPRVAARFPLEFEGNQSRWNIENSPSVWGYNVATALYNGLGPNGRNIVAGVQKMHWDPDSNAFKTDWVNTQAMLNSVLLYSQPSQMVYGIGKDLGGTERRPLWRLIGLDAESGLMTYSAELGRSSANNGGNILQLDDDRSLMTGSQSGVLQMRVAK